MCSSLQKTRNLGRRREQRKTMFFLQKTEGSHLFLAVHAFLHLLGRISHSQYVICTIKKKEALKSWINEQGKDSKKQNLQIQPLPTLLNEATIIKMVTSQKKIESTNKENNTRSGLPKSYQDRTEKGTGQKQFARSHPLPWNRDRECRWCCGSKIWPPVSPRMWRCVLVTRAGSIAVPTKERHCCLGSYGREWKASFDVHWISLGPTEPVSTLDLMWWAPRVHDKVLSIFTLELLYLHWIPSRKLWGHKYAKEISKTNYWRMIFLWCLNPSKYEHNFFSSWIYPCFSLPLHGYDGWAPYEKVT